MNELDSRVSIRGERSMSQGFVAQYAAEAARQVQGVAGLETGVLVSLKEVIGGDHVGKGVRVDFGRDDSGMVSVSVYPIVCFGYILPDVAWQIQERVKKDVERYTGLIVDKVDVQIMGIREG